MRPTCFIVYRLLAATLAVLALTAPRALAEPSTTIRSNGSPSNRVDVTILGDGYTAAEMGKYASDVEAFVTGFFAQQPFDEYQFLFNVHRVDVVSAQSGADHPERSPAVFKNTALDATYNCAAIQRLICVDMTKVNNVLSASVPAEKRDVVLIIVNDPEYGGSGGAVAVASTHTAAVEVVLHELGHTLGLLADEYAGGGPSCNASVEPSEANATRATTRPTIKWNAWIDTTTPIPTFGPTVGLPGLYEEAKYCFIGLYRPTYDSKMRSLDRPFEQINNEQLVKRFYNWAAPIDAITPSGSVSLGTAHSQTFTVTTQTPRTHALDVRWRVDGGAVAGTGPSFVLNGSTLAPGNHTVTVEVSDPTAFVRVDPAGALDDNRVWTVNVFTEGGGGSGANLQVLVDGKSVTAAGPYAIKDMTKNVGTGAALASNTKFYLSINNVWDAFDNVLEPAAGRNVPALNPGASHIASTMLTIPAGTPPGPYYLIARADANGVVAETSEADNTVARAITIIAAAPDLVVKNVVAPAAADRGASISITELTGNAGGAPTTVNIITRFYLSLNQSVDAADVTLGPGRTVGPLAAGAGSTGTTSVVIPAGTAVGNYYLLVRGDDSGQVVESNETNNLGGRLITIR